MQMPSDNSPVWLLAILLLVCVTVLGMSAMLFKNGHDPKDFLLAVTAAGAAIIVPDFKRRRRMASTATTRKRKPKASPVNPTSEETT